jgi:hypothetical protein
MRSGKEHQAIRQGILQNRGQTHARGGALAQYPGHHTHHLQQPSQNTGDQATGTALKHVQDKAPQLSTQGTSQCDSPTTTAETGDSQARMCALLPQQQRPPSTGTPCISALRLRAQANTGGVNFAFWSARWRCTPCHTHWKSRSQYHLAAVAQPTLRTSLQLEQTLVKRKGCMRNHNIEMQPGSASPEQCCQLHQSATTQADSRHW